VQEQDLAQISLQKRLLDADFLRRAAAILASGLAALKFLSPAQVAFYLCSYFLCDIALKWALGRLIEQPTSAYRLQAVQTAAFASMCAYLTPVIMLWPLPDNVARTGIMIYVFGGMLSIMLVRSAYRPLTIANSLPLALIMPPLIIVGATDEALGDRVFLSIALLVLAAYFALTLHAALKINGTLADGRDAALARVETQRRFLATMSHELRTPLNGILGIAQSMVATHPGQGAEIVRDNAREMAVMIDDLLDNAAIEAGALRIVRRPVPLLQVKKHIEERWRSAFADKGLWLHLTIAAELPEQMMLDPLRLSQCLSNLLANALRLTTSGGINIDLRALPGGMEALVSDTGPGLPAGMETRLFRPFESIHVPGAGQRPGTGLGLSITRGLARAMGGDLVYERPEAGGSRFRLTLKAEPVRADTPQPAAAERGLFPGPAAGLEKEPWGDKDHPLSGKTILLVDDIATNRLVLRILLKDLAVDTVEAASGAEALRLLQDPNCTVPDVALMDIRMPELSGTQTLAHMRAAGHHFPVIAVTADAASEGRAAILAQGFDGHLTKPVEAAQLRHALLHAVTSGTTRL